MQALCDAIKRQNLQTLGIKEEKGIGNIFNKNNSRKLH
jgi:hypothetical protein